MKRVLINLAVLAATSIVAAQTVTVGLFQDPTHLDPAQSTATSEYVVMQQIYDTLLTFDANGDVTANLATDWAISEDGLTYSFTLREGVSFHDGTPFNAEAMKYSLDRTRSFDGGAFIEQLSNIESVDVTGDYTLEITLAEPQGAFLTYMADRSGTAVSPAVENLTGQPTGTGPFSFVSRTAQDNITLAANPDYWDGAPQVERVVFRFFPDGSVRYANLRSGSVDIIYPIEARDYVTAQNESSISLLTQPTNGWRVLVMNTTRPPFDNPAVREALALSIDRAAINQIVFNGLEAPATSLIPASSPYFTENDVSINASVEDALQVLADAGVTGASATLTTFARSPEDQLSQLTQAMASAVGIDLRIETVESGEYQRRYGAKDFDIMTMQWSGQADPDANVTSFLSTGAFWNWSSYSVPEVDELLAAAQSSSDVSTRRDLYGQVFEHVTSDWPIIPLTNQVRLIATGSDIEGVRLQANTGILILKSVSVNE